MAADYPWEEIRRRWEYGTSENRLSEIYGCSRMAIYKRRKSEGWLRSAEAQLQLADRVVDRLAGVKGEEPGTDEERQLQAEADKIAEVTERHRREWRVIQGLFYDAIKDAKPDPSDPEQHRAGIRLARAELKTKIIKRAAETLRIIQTGERVAWGISQDVSDGGGNVLVEIAYINGQPMTRGTTYDHGEEG